MDKWVVGCGCETCGWARVVEDNAAGTGFPTGKMTNHPFLYIGKIYFPVHVGKISFPVYLSFLYLLELLFPLFHFLSALFHHL